MVAPREDRAAYWAVRTGVLVVVSVAVLVLGAGGLDGRDRVLALALGAAGLVTSAVIALLWRRGRL
jgi:hypothetical protein